MTVLRSLSIAALTSSLVATPTLVARAHRSTSVPSSRVAYVDYQKILAQAPGRAAAESAYTQEVVAMHMQLQQIDDSLKMLVAAFKNDSHGLVRGQTIGDREQAYQQRSQDLHQQMQQRQADLSRPMIEQISKVLDELRVQGNYAMIFDIDVPSKVVVSADASLDLTDQVIARLKQLGPPPATSSH